MIFYIINFHLFRTTTSFAKRTKNQLKFWNPWAETKMIWYHGDVAFEHFQFFNPILQTGRFKRGLYSTLQLYKRMKIDRFVLTIRFISLTLTPLNLTKHYCRKWKNWSSPTTSSIQGLYTFGITGHLASQAWLGMRGQGIGVRGVLGSIPREPPLLMVSVSNEIG